ncbi:MAG: hypothetical protein EOP10_20140 [Proteobacteria bacterium]|nr:MAG: hypothetical protein EOP10_20140 [Pseudomonadota bacterium]
MKKGFLLVSLLSLSALSNACHQSMKARESNSSPGSNIVVSYTTVARNENALPRCDAGTEGLKAYLSETDNFIQCSSFSWRSATPGDVSLRYVSREPVRFYEWFDSKENRRWLAPIAKELAADSVKAKACQAGWKLPTELELVVASKNGLFDGIKSHGGIAFDKAWIDSTRIISGISRGELELETTPAKDKPSTAGVYCISA